MKFKKKFILNIFLAFLVSSLIVIFSEQGFLKRLKLDGLDLLFRLRGVSAYNPHIIIVEIDNENISKVGRWPWSRDWHAAITSALKALGAKQIYFDFLFSEASSEENDGIFSEAIKDAGNVYLPFAFQGRSRDMANALVPIERFSSRVKGVGSINIYPDTDGTLRKIPLFLKANGNVYPHIVLKIVMDYLDMGISRIISDRLVLTNSQEEIQIPLVEKNRMLVNWLGKWEATFTHYSFLDVLVAYKAFLSDKTPKIDIRPFRGSICLVAVTAIGLYDIEPIPLAPEYPGIGTLATAISNILDRKFLVSSPFWLNWMFIYILSLVPFLFISGKKSLREILSVASIAAVFFFMVILLFKNNFWLDFALPLFSLFASYLSVASFQFVYVSLEKQRFFKLAVTDGLTGLSNIRFFKRVLGDECLIAGEEPAKGFCVIMGDIDNFKHFNDTYGHMAGDIVLKRTADVLKASVRSSDVVARYGGEELIILLRGAALENGLKVAGKIRKNMEDLVITDGDNTYRVTLSLGIASFHPQDDENTIIKRADDGLYNAKRSGKNRVETIEG
ncbi:MAG: hypothetical protein DRP85_01670 [Candidatus Makaraimicrobium thalassicum]|nr:MAG: hypothetical protein DRP85_01670 [Candidatus Omnitrophota bacterium]